MTKHINKFSIRIVIALVLGLLLDSRTTIQAPRTSAPPGKDIEKCVSFPEAISQSSKLLANEQNSLLRFSTTFAATLATSFATLSLFSFYKNRKPK
jgi:hypothetical protein